MDRFFYAFCLLVAVRLFLWLLMPGSFANRRIRFAWGAILATAVIIGFNAFVSTQGPERFYKLAVWVDEHIDSTQTLLRLGKYKLAAYSDHNLQYKKGKWEFNAEEVFGYDVDKYGKHSAKRQKSQIFLYRGQALAKLKKYAASLSAYSRARSNIDNRDTIYFLQFEAEAKRDSGLLYEALADYQTIIRENEKYRHYYVDIINVHHGQGVTYERMDSLEKAHAFYQKAQDLAYKYMPCACYESEDDFVDPFKCKFTWFDIDIDQLEPQTMEDILVSKGYKFTPKPEKPRAIPSIIITDKEKSAEDYFGTGPGKDDKKQKRKTAEDYFGPRKKTDSDSLVQQHTDEPKNKKAKAKPKRQLTYKERMANYKRDYKLWKEKEYSLKSAFTDSLALRRRFTADSPLAYAHLSQGQLFLKQAKKDSAAIDFVELIKLCPDDESGACGDLASLIGNKNFRRVRHALKGTPDDVRIAMANALKIVKVKNGKLIKRRGWGIYFLILLGGLIGRYFFWRYKRIKPTK